MRTKWTVVSPHSGMDEDAPANNAGSGNVSMPPDAIKKKKKTLRTFLRSAIHATDSTLRG